MLRGMNDFDKLGRYLIKQDPAGFFRWLFGVGAVSFYSWLDARRTALAELSDQTGDVVAAFRAVSEFEALCVELQARSHKDTARRLLLGYVPRLAAETGGLALAAVGGAVVNFTGPAQPAVVRLTPSVAPTCRFEGEVLQRTLRDEDAEALLAAVTAGRVSRWLLGWLPLLRGGGDPGIIPGWRREARRLPNPLDRGDVGLMAKVFARLARRSPVWEAGLEGWDVETSPVLDEYRAKFKALGLAEGRAEGQRNLILQVGEKKFGRPPTRKQRAALDAVADLARLGRIGGRLLDAADWADLLATP
jgi:hypothetical protein